MNRHPLDATSMICGVVFAVVAGVYLTGAATGGDVNSRWVLPLALIGLGVAGVVGAVTSAARQRPAPPVPAASPAESEVAANDTVELGDDQA
jgi:hypothetical protein